MRVTVYTDGSFCRKSNAAGWAYSIKHHALAKYMEASGGCHADSNNHSEWLALEKAQQTLLALGVTGAIVRVYTDSEYCVRWFNPTLLMSAGAQSVNLSHTKGHQGARNMLALNNGHVDRLAKSAMRAFRDSPPSFRNHLDQDQQELPSCN